MTNSNKLLLVHPNVPRTYLLTSAIADGVDVRFLNWEEAKDLTPYFDSGVRRVGLMWDNVNDRVWSGTPLNLDKKKYRLFTQEVYDFLKLYDDLNFGDRLTVDLISCNFFEPGFMGEVMRFADTLNGVSKINYSLNQTGSSESSDWILESSGESLKGMYFNNTIDSYPYVLGSTAGCTGYITNGEVFMFGSNELGELGQGAGGLEFYTKPVQVPNIDNAVKLSCGRSHVAILLDDGTVMVSGLNTFGQLGDGTFNSVDVFQPVPGVSNVAQVRCGFRNTYFLLDDGTVLGCGDNQFGQLAQDPNGSPMFMESNVPILIDGLNDVIDISAGSDYVLALLSDSTVKSFGRNGVGQLGVGSVNPFEFIPMIIPGINTAIAIGAGFDHGAIVLGDGTIRTFGFNGFGSLGDGTNVDSNVPVTVLNIDNAVNVTGMNNATIVLLDNGQLKSFGQGAGNGRLGSGEYIDSNVPVDVIGIDYAVAISSNQVSTSVLQSDGRVVSFGSNFFGLLGICQNTFFSTLTETLVSDVQDTQGGQEFTLFLKNDGTVLSVGQNNAGQLGIGSFENQIIPTPIPGLSNVTQISCGSFHSIVLLADGTVRTFGLNGNGRLGDGTTITRNAPVDPGVTDAVFVACGMSHTLVVQSDGTVLGFGANGSAKLGDIDNNFDFSDRLVPTPLDSLGLTNVVKVGAGRDHSIFLNADGSVVGLGLNGSGELGTSSSVGIFDPFAINPVPTSPAISNAVDVKCGSNHTIVLLADGTVRTFGFSLSGQTGTGAFVSLFTPTDIGLTNVAAIHAGFFHSLVQFNDGTASAFGNNTRGKLGVGEDDELIPSPTNVPVDPSATVTASGNSTYAYFEDPEDSDRQTLAAGDNFVGELGLGFRGSRPFPVPLFGSPLVRSLADEARGLTDPIPILRLRYWNSVLNGLC